MDTSKKNRRSVHRYQAYWEHIGQPPEAFILCTASARKIYLAHQILLGTLNKRDRQSGRPNILFDQEVLECQRFLESTIYNGDGAYHEPHIIPLGDYFGVRVGAVTTSGEEPDGISPEEQAALKLRIVLDRFIGRDMMLMSVDSVVKKGAHHLGKPLNMDGFPQRTDPDYEHKALQFKQRYREEHYGQPDVIENWVGIAVAWTHTPGMIRKTRLSINLPFTPDQITTEMIDEGGAAGGVIQKIYPFQAVRDQFAHKKEGNRVANLKEGVFWERVIYMTMVGMPLFSMLALATEELSERRKVQQKRVNMV